MPKLSKAAKCMGMGVYITDAMRLLDEAYWSIQKGQIESAQGSTRMASYYLNNLKKVDGQFSSKASKIERTLRRVLKSCGQVPDFSKGFEKTIHAKAQIRCHKSKAKKGLIATIVQAQKLKEEIARGCGLPKDLLRP